MLGIAIALLSAATSGLSIVLVRKYSDHSNTFNISLILTVVGMAILWPAALIASEENLAISVGAVAFFAVSGVLSPGIVRLLYYKGMSKLGAPVTSAVYATNPLYSSLLAVLLLGEVLTNWNIIGVAAIIVGIVLMEINPSRSLSQAKRQRRYLLLPAIAAFTLGVSSIIRKYALDISNMPILGVAIAYTFSLAPYAFMLAMHRPTQRKLNFKKNLRWFWAAGIGQAITWLLAFYALNIEQVSITMPLLATEPLFVGAFAIVYLKELEQISAWLLASIAITVFGVICITL
ncbi:MAG: DMT family transporter [Candidatus Bathyarchaeota archaeon]|nr:DMT family transporter [Candidatus Bathyarchaeota archaeon]